MLSIACKKWIVALGVGLIALLPGCSETEPKSLHLLTIDPLRSQINPWSVMYASDFLIATSISSPFIEIDQNEKWSFPFCSSWKRFEAEDRLTCELADHLRWSDGSPMKAVEVLDSLNESVRVSRSSGIAQIVKRIWLTSPTQLSIEFNRNGLNSLWAFTGLDQLILDPESREQIRKNGSLHLEGGLKRSSGRFRLVAMNSGHVLLEPNPYFPVKSSRAESAVEIVGNLSTQQIEDRLAKRAPGDLAQILGGSIADSGLARIREAGFQEFNQPVPNAISAFYLGKRAMKSMSRSERRYLFASVAKKMLESQDKIGQPAIGLTPPSILGALDRQSWKDILSHSPPAPNRPLKVDLFVMDAFKSTQLYLAAKAAIEELPVKVNEVVYDPEDPSSTEWKRRSSNDYDLLFGYDESYSPDPDPFWRDVRDFAAPTKSFFSDAELTQALFEMDLKKRAMLYQNFEHKCADDPFIIPLRRFGNELFVAPGIEVEPQEAFGLMVNLWAFKAPKSLF